MENKKNFKKAKENIKSAIENALNGIGTFVVAEAQMRTPVDTSTLRRGETFEVDTENKVLYVGSNVPYDEYVELGTSKQKSQPHWNPAVMDNIEDINKILKKHLEKVGDE